MYSTNSKLKLFFSVLLDFNLNFAKLSLSIYQEKNNDLLNESNRNILK